MTSIGFRSPGAFVPPALPRTSSEVARPRRVAAPPVASTWARVGRVDLHAARRYLSVWMAVLFVVLLAVSLLGYVVLAALGVLGSVSRALALVSDQESSGLMPALQPQHVLPLLVVLSLAVSGLCYVMALGAVLVHNATTSLTGGLRVRVRPEQSPPLR